GCSGDLDERNTAPRRRHAPTTAARQGLVLVRCRQFSPHGPTRHPRRPHYRPSLRTSRFCPTAEAMRQNRNKVGESLSGYKASEKTRELASPFPDNALDKAPGGKEAFELWYDDRCFPPQECELPVDRRVLSEWHE